MILSDKTALITGASSGIGKCLADEFHARGCRVILVARRGERLKEISDTLNKIRDNSASYYICDLTARDSTTECLNLESLVDQVSSSEIDILVNNAGRGSFGPFDELDIDSEVQMIELNLTAPVKLTHALIPQMKARETGAIINISSVAGFQPVPFMSVYSGTKAFNYCFSMSLRHELSEFGIRVLTVCPGPTISEFGSTPDMNHRRSAAKDTSKDVARETVEALISNRSWIVTASWSRLLALPCRLLPKSLTTWILGKDTSSR